jgi:predicted ATPase
VIYPVTPLATAGARNEPWERIAGCEAVRLFAERAAAARPGFAVTAVNAEVVGRVCRRLDGLPLGVELAAARMSSMPLDQLAERLEHSFALLDSASRATAERHRGLSASVRWSWELLDGMDQALLGRLAVFPASFTLAAAEHVAAGPGLEVGVVAAGLARLVTRSLVQLDDTGRPDQTRYRLLEAVRDYGRHLLDPALAARLRARHARWCLEVAEQAEPHLLRAGSAPWLALLHREHHHVRAALQWAFDPGGDPLVGARLIRCLWHLWDLRGARGEGAYWVHTALDAIGDRDPAQRLALLAAGALFHLGRAEFDVCTRLADEQLGLSRAETASVWQGQALAMLATAAWARGQFDKALPLYREAVAASLAGGDLWRASLEQSQLARLHRDRHEPGEAMTVARRALAHAHEVGEGLACGLALDVLASLEHHRGDLAAARALNQQAQQQYALVGYVEGEASALDLAGHIALASGDLVAAREGFERSLRRRRRIGHREGTALALEGLAEVALAVADEEAAALLLGAAAAVRREIGGAPSASVTGHDHDHRARLADTLGPVLAEQSLHRGADTTIDEVIRRSHTPPERDRDLGQPPVSRH